MISTLRTRCAPLASRLVSASRCASTIPFLDKQVPIQNQLLINNQWRAAENEKTFDITNPATGQDLFKCASASKADVDLAVKSSRECFRSKEWKAMTGKQRGDILRKMGDLMADETENLARLETLDNGKPIIESRADVEACVAVLRFYAGMADDLDVSRTEAIKTEDKDFEVRNVKVPIGTIGMITPWNFPIMQAVPKVAPAIAAGCTMVLKPSSVCSATTLRLGEIAIKAGLPAGALNIVTGTGRETGAALIDHQGLDALSFTGSSAIGHDVLHAGAKKLLPSLVELGGKGAIVVFDDVDIDVAVDWIMVGIFLCSGQVCSATSRLIVHKDIEPKLMARLVEETKKLRMGDPCDETTQLGSLTSADQVKIVEGFVERAVKEGAELVCGGKKGPGQGNFYEATILRNLKSDSEAWVEEIFGPVLAVKSFSTEEEAVQIANDTQYGLGNAVITRDADRCERVAQQLHAGIVWKNCTNAIPAECPFGGFKQSGFGKEYGALGLEEYLQTKTICGAASDFSWEWYVPKKK